MNALRQALVVVGIFAFTAMFGGTIVGLRAILGSAYVEPECAQMCASRGQTLVDVDYHSDKQRTPSVCVCSGSVTIASERAGTVAHASVGGAILLAIVASGAMVFVLYRRSRARR